MKRMLCPFHQESTPSLVLYENSYKCYGCGKSGAIEEVEGAKPGFTVRVSIENLASKLKKIKELPIENIRGIELPFDSEGYYIVYPNTQYYAKRLWIGNNNNKYRNPAGHSKRLFFVSGSDKETLFIVEGQLNALSLAKVTEHSIASPGSANDLSNKQFYSNYLQYKKVCIIVDDDAVGIVNALQLKSDLLELANIRCTIYPMSRDLNDILIGPNGIEELKKEEQKALDML